MKTVFNRLSISHKIGGVFLFLLLMMGVGGSVGLYNAGKIAEVTGDLYNRSFTRADVISSVEREFLSQRLKLIQHTIIDDDGSKVFLEGRIGAHTNSIKALLNKYGAGGEGAETTDTHIKALSVELEEYWVLQELIMRTSRSGDREGALNIVRVEGNKGFDIVVNKLEGTLKKETDAALTAYKESEYLSRNITSVTLLFTIVAIIVAAALWLVLTRSIVAPIFAIGSSAKRMAGGDLTQRAPVLAGDEIGMVAGEFNRMAESLQDYYATLENKVQERTEELDIANKELGERKAEVELKNEELAKASRMKSQFLANVSHELRTPLNSIIGFSELLNEKTFGELNDKQNQYVDYIHTSGAHLLELINSILDLSKIEAGRMELLPEDFSLDEVLGEAIASVRPIAEKRKIEVAMKEGGDPLVIRADRGKFKQVVLNLLSNAVKFNRDGGRVDVDWTITEEACGDALERCLVMTVKDTGIGIKPEDLPKLFGEFEQLNPEVTREYGGTGLGLALTKRLIELHEGSISVTSDEGEGCTFTVKLPQGTEKLSTPTHEGSLASREQIIGSPLVIVAGESEDINQLLDIYLTSEGYEVTTAVDGEELMTLAVEKKPFAIVMDVAVQKKDGWDVLKELKASSDTEHIPAVIISTAENMELGFSLGAVDYLVKPVNRESLLQTLSRLNFEKRGHSRILVVDDEPSVLELLSDMLGGEGHEIFTAEGGREGIKLAAETLPDLIILDLMMPEVSGFDVVEKLKESVLTKDIPVVIFTAKDVTTEDKARLGENIQKIIKKAGFSKKDLLSELKLLETAFPEKASMVDAATGIFNMRYFDVALSREVAKSVKLDISFSVVMLRVDGLAGVGAAKGREVVDAALGEVGVFMKKHMRRTDCLTRGGDDLMLILPGIAKRDVVGVAEKLRALVESNDFHIDGFDDGSRLTVSVATITLPLDKEVKVVETLEDILGESAAAGGNTVSHFGGAADA